MCMVKNNNLVKKELVVECNGIGETKQLAVEKAFSEMRMQVVDLVKEPIISLDTDKVEILDLETINKTEAYLGFFFKREKLSYSIKLRVYINVRYLTLEGR